MKIIKVVFWGPVLILRAITMPEKYQDQYFFEGMLVAILGIAGTVALGLLALTLFYANPVFSGLGVVVYFLLRRWMLVYLKKKVGLG